MLIVPLALFFGLSLLGLVCWVEWSTSAPTAPQRHTLDCLDWRRRGERDNTCTAHHGTDWFAPIETETP